ncbi:hypothetical protein [Sphingomonas sp. 35-24ZXX]|uniref:hypothetical protein n=1 Tax=Sphingomonas sp. 35-24ZXX TaxID=1545915 RepID=UPI0018CD9C3A|nr:hypothetical protein [Sphingomonas sp. 35-24ZXX]
MAASNFYGIAQYGNLAAAIAAGEAATDLGSLFSVDDGVGNLVFRAKTVAGSLEVARTITPASLASPEGAGISGYAKGAAFEPGTVGHKLAQIVLISDAPFNASPDASAASNADAIILAAAAVGVGGTIIVPDGIFVIDPVDISGVHLAGTGTLRSTKAAEEQALLTAIGSKISGITIDAPTYCLYGVKAGGANPQIDGVTFTGAYGHCGLFDDADYPLVTRCVLPEGGEHTTPFVFQNCRHPAAIGNTIEEHTGFGIQFRWSTDCMANNNQIRQRVYTKEFVATAATQTFRFTTGRSVMRFAASANGVFKEIGGTVKIVATEFDVEVLGLIPGQSVIIYGFVGLESIQFNSGCDGFIAAGNIITGGGDSGIVVGADYHLDGEVRVLESGDVIQSDWPRNGTIGPNKIRGPIHASGIALNQAANVIVSGNIISDAGYINDPAYRCGISCGEITGCHVDGNVYEDLNGQASGAVRYQGGDVSNSFGYNKGLGCSNFQPFADTSPNLRRTGFTLTAAIRNNLITRQLETMMSSGWTSGAYTSTDFALSISGGTGLELETVDTFGTTSGLRTSTGEFVDLSIAPRSLPQFQDRFVKVSFYSKGQGYVELFYDFPGDDPEPRYTFNINDADHTYHEVVMAVGAIDGLLLRIGSGPGDEMVLSLLALDTLTV